MAVRSRPFKRWLLGAVACVALFAVTPANAESMETALAAVYENNPAIAAARAHLRATDEELAKAQSGFRPQIAVSADLGASVLDSSVKPPKTANGSTPPQAVVIANENALKVYDGGTRPGGVGVTVAQSLFDGFQTVNGVKVADATIMAERAGLLDTEQRTLLDTVRAYMDVLRDAATVRLRINSLRLLTSEEKATQERYAGGETTRTDVAEAQARKAGAQGELDGAKATLRGSLANYERLVGHIPKQLSEPKGFERLLPAQLEDAIAVSVAQNPQILQAAYTEKASKYEISKTLGEMLPQVVFQAQHSERYDPSVLLYQQSTDSAVVRVNIPLYQGGDVEARVRQAKQARQGHMEEIEQARELARAQAIATFAQVTAMRAQLLAVRQQVRAATESLAGTREEQMAGQRTLLDVLNTEQELTNAQISAVNARHDLVVASYSLLAVMGRLTATELGLGVQLYDADQHYQQTNGRWAGTSIVHDAGYVNPDAAAAVGWSTEVQPQQ